MSGAFFFSALLIGALFWDEANGRALLMEGGAIIAGVIFLSLAKSIGG
jgi:hypothetical protein